MIQRVLIQNGLTGYNAAMTLSSPGDTGLIIASITGLNPVNTTLHIVDHASSAGGTYNSNRVGTRNIVFQFVYDRFSNVSIEEIRHRTYLLFAIGSEVEMMFITSGDGKTERAYRIFGRVESNDINLFTKQETSQISIVCPDPYFYESTADSITASNLSSRAAFYFPFATAPITSDLPVGDAHGGYYFSYLYRSDGGTITCIYPSNVPAGVLITITVNEALEFVKLKFDGKEIKLGGNYYFRGDVRIGFKHGDQIILDSRFGARIARLSTEDSGEEQAYTFIKMLQAWPMVKYGVTELELIEDSKTKCSVNVEFPKMAEGI